MCRGGVGQKEGAVVLMWGISQGLALVQDTGAAAGGQQEALFATQTIINKNTF